MAKRTLRPRHQDEIRAKIGVSQLITLLNKHALGKKLKTAKGDMVELSPSRIKAAEILLRKVIPDLSSTEISGQLTTYAADLQAIADARAATAMPAASDAVQQQPAQSPAPLPPVVH